jgi:ketosteroid isomerase-like protein
MIKSLSLVLVGLGALVLRAEDPHVNAVKERQREFENALVAADVPRLEQMLTGDFLRTGTAGQETDKAAYSKLVRSGELKYLSFEDRAQKYRVYGDTVLENKFSHVRYRMGAVDHEVDVKLLWVWVRRDKQWLLATVQGTLVSAPQ